LRGVIRAGIVAAAIALFGASSAEALTLQTVGSFDQPIYVTSDPGDADRLFVVEREGTIQSVENGTPSLFADLSAEVECKGSCQGERGLLSIALAPDFGSSGQLFAFYANDENGTLHVDELEAAGPDQESAAISRSLPTIPHPLNNHNGGQLQFGPDGDLYISTGDGGGANDPSHNAQNPASMLGKILRIDPDSTGPYEVWSRGLRNPYRFSFDALSGDMVIGDVGQAQREEIDFAPSPGPGITGGAGANYGWSCREGFIAGETSDPLCASPPAFVDPVFDYPHSPDPDSDEPRCSITGGYVARDPGLGALYGRYVYADYCAGTLRSLQLPTGKGGAARDDCSLDLQLDSPVSFGEDAARRLYVVEQGGGVYRLAGQPPASCPSPPLPPPEATQHPLAPTFVGITAQRHRVERGKAALLTVWVSPCKDRKGDTVVLLRNGRRNGSRFLSRACTARFLRRIHRGTRFAASTYQDADYLAGASRNLRIRIAPHRRARPR
jgi:Glucose / Sorbosone dehydrogenase